MAAERDDQRVARSRAVIAVCGLVFGVGMIGLVKDRLIESDRYVIGPILLRMGPLPRALEDHRDRLLDGGPILAGPRSIFDPRLPTEIRERLLQRPWVRSVSRMRRRLPDGLRIHVQLRFPVAVVCIGAERLAVDRDGVVLESDSKFGPPECPEIHALGEQIRMVPLDGHPFERASVLEALAVLRDIERVRQQGHTALESVRIEAVIVGEEGKARREGAADVQLLLDNGVRVAWGRSSRSPLYVFDLSVVRKLDNLNRLRRAYPGLLGLERIDLRPKDPLVYTRSS